MAARYMAEAEMVLAEGTIIEDHFSPVKTPLGEKSGLWVAFREQSSGPPLRVEILGNGGDKLRRVHGGCDLSVRIISRHGNTAQAVVHKTEAEVLSEQRDQFKGMKAKKRAAKPAETTARKKSKKS